MILLRLLILCLMGLVPLGAAHARDLNIITYTTTVAPLWQMASSVPADNALLDAPPHNVTVNFSQNIDPAKSTLSVYDPYNTPLSNISVKANGFSLTATLPPLQTGTYRVEWQATCLCQGSTPLNGILHFTVQ